MLKVKHLAKSQTILWLVSGRCSEMWLLTSPFLTADLLNCSLLVLYVNKCSLEFLWVSPSSRCRKSWLRTPASLLQKKDLPIFYGAASFRLSSLNFVCKGNDREKIHTFEFCRVLCLSYGLFYIVIDKKFFPPVFQFQRQK